MGNGLNPIYLRGATTSGGQAISGYAFVDQSGNLAVNASVVATANISGQSVFVMSGSGPLNIVGASGAGATLSGIAVIATVNATANISGQAVFLGSGSTFGISGVPVSLFSGSNNVREVGTTIINSSLSGAYIITGNSGGNILFSGGPLISTTLRSASGNNIMFIGGLGTNAPTTNVGIPLFPNETLTLKVSNFNSISAFASVSGQVLYYLGLQ